MAGAASGANARIGYLLDQSEAIQRRRDSLTGVRRRCRYLPSRQRVSAVQFDVTVCAGSHDRDMFERPTAAERRHRMTVGARLIVEQWTDTGRLLCKEPLSLGEPGELIGGEVGAGVDGATLAPPAEKARLGSRAQATSGVGQRSKSQ